MKNPIGIRFNDEKLEFVKTNENLSSPQKVVNYLLDKYWWEHKISGNPVLERQELKIKPYTKIPNEPASEPNEADEQINYSSAWFRTAFQKAKDAEELERLGKLMLSKIEGVWSQNQLKEYASEIYKEKFNF
jgi:hypothetical protein